ncbi:MAG: Flp pilus assembly complex ATPase component TadA [Candidatus Sungbacteria bacterium]|nr:Flp pilus assembly complex ATPase component TadA [Candidatus Sungbacteria bacterium]
MRVEENQLKAFILDSGLLTPDKLAKAEQDAAKLKKPLREVLLNKDLIKEEELLHLEAYILGIPFVDLSKEIVNPEILHIIPEPIARKHNVVSFKKNGTNLEVAMLDPGNLQTLEFIRKKEGLRILPRLTTPDSIKHILKQYQKSLEAEFGEIIKKDIGDVTLKFTKSGGEEVEIEAEDLKKMAEDLPVIRIVDTLIRHAILQLASDIHIEPQEKEVLVRYRIDGILHDAMTLPKQIATGIVARIKVMANLKLDEHRLPQDGRFKIETEEYRISFRVSVLPVMEGEKIVMRLLPEGAKGFSLEELGFLGTNLDRIHRAIKRPTGILLATGPTGSGKTTTLYTILEMLNTPGVNISTIEDPIEYRIPRINQTQVRPDIGLSFANGLRTLLRQDPNIIMVGEIRDNETAALAINAALTGHLVLSTLHTNSAAGALPRLIDMKVEPFLIASTVTAIISQRLVRRLCSEHDSYQLSSAEISSLKKDLNFDRVAEMLKHEKIIDSKIAAEKIGWSKPKKSEECADGYRGRIGVHEVLEMSESIKELLMKNATSDDIEKRAKEEGMLSMLDEGFIRAAQGVTTIEEILRVTSE